MILVERENSEDSDFYYIVPFRTQDGGAPFVAQVDAYQNGSFSGSISAAGESTHIAPQQLRQAALERLFGISVSVNGEKITLRREDLNDHLFWQPCKESLSPYWPFYRFDAIGRHGPTKVYVRIDGLLVPELHFGKGI